MKKMLLGAILAAVLALPAAAQPVVRTILADPRAAGVPYYGEYGDHLFVDPLLFWGPGPGLSLPYAYYPFPYYPGPAAYVISAPAQPQQPLYHDGYWWWWESAGSRWLFSYDGAWWWQGPDGEMYTYSQGNYVPYPPQPPPPPAAP